ncbi:MULTISPECIES: hypothetical protein [Paraburkholderia]|uniref:hypothetical protein n=1 Tax=Paraburkholderia TaxID=1822464 RepID=UPI000841B5C6|nr:hypothetical protein [Paraburkholderia nodosa]
MSKGHAIKAQVGQMIERERNRCRMAMGEKAWKEHDEWVTQYIIASAKQWLTRQAAEGRL